MSDTPRKVTHTLSPAQLERMRRANELLTGITESHGLWCDCDWCSARELTDTQDPESWTVEAYEWEQE